MGARNDKRRCETCAWWFRNDDLLPEEDLPKIPGTCGHRRMPSDGEWRLPLHGQRCKGWAAQPREPSRATPNPTRDGVRE